MDKFKPLEDWLNNAKKFDCGDFLAMAINEERGMVSVASCSAKNMLEMLLTAANKNKSFMEALMATATIIAKKKSTAEDAKPKFIARKGGVK